MKVINTNGFKALGTITLLLVSGLFAVMIALQDAYAQAIPCGATGGGCGGNEIPAQEKATIPWSSLPFCTQCNIAAANTASAVGDRGKCCADKNEDGSCDTEGCEVPSNLCVNQCWATTKGCFQGCELYSMHWRLACPPENIVQNPPEDKISVTLTGPTSISLECRLMEKKDYKEFADDGEDYYGNHTGAADIKPITDEIAAQAAPINCFPDDAGTSNGGGPTMGDADPTTPGDPGCKVGNQKWDGPQALTYECAPTACWNAGGVVSLDKCDFPQGTYEVVLNVTVDPPVCTAEAPPKDDACFGAFDPGDVRVRQGEIEACGGVQDCGEPIKAGSLGGTCGNNACPCQTPNITSITKDETCLPGERVIIQSLTVEVSRPVVPYEEVWKPNNDHYYQGADTIWCHLPKGAKGDRPGTQYVEMMSIHQLKGGQVKHSIVNGECVLDEKDVGNFTDLGEDYDPAYFADKKNPPKDVPLQWYDPNKPVNPVTKVIRYSIPSNVPIPSGCVHVPVVPDMPNPQPIDANKDILDENDLVAGVYPPPDRIIIECTVHTSEDEQNLPQFPGVVNTPALIAAGNSQTEMGGVRVRSLSCPKLWDVFNPPRNISLGEGGEASCRKVGELATQIPHFNIFGKGQDPFGLAHSVTTAVNQLEAKQTDDNTVPLLFVALTEPVRKCLASANAGERGSIYPDAKPYEGRLAATKWSSHGNATSGKPGADSDRNGYLDTIACAPDLMSNDFSQSYFKTLRDAAQRVKDMGGYVVVLAMSCQSQAFLDTVADMSTGGLNVQAFAPEGVVIGDCNNLLSMKDDEREKVEIASGGIWFIEPGEDNGLLFRSAYAQSSGPGRQIFFSDFMGEIVAELGWVIVRNEVGREVCANSSGGVEGDFCSDTATQPSYMQWRTTVPRP